MGNLTDSQKAEIYKTFQSTDFGTNGEFPEGVPEDFALSVQIAVRVANQTDFETFSQFIDTGEVPPVQLSQKELEALKGGYISFDISPKTARNVFEGVYRTGLRFTYETVQRPFDPPIVNLGRAIYNVWDSWDGTPGKKKK